MWCLCKHHMHGFVQDCMELLHSCTNPWICCMYRVLWFHWPRSICAASWAKTHTGAKYHMGHMMGSLIAMFMGPAWGPPGANRTQVGPMLAPWTLLSGLWLGHQSFIVQSRTDPKVVINVITDLIHKSHNAPAPYPTIHHSEQKCAHFCSVWCIVGYGTGALWNLQDWLIATPLFLKLLLKKGLNEIHSIWKYSCLLFIH